MVPHVLSFCYYKLIIPCPDVCLTIPVKVTSWLSGSALCDAPPNSATNSDCCTASQRWPGNALTIIAVKYLVALYTNVSCIGGVGRALSHSNT